MTSSDALHIVRSLADGVDPSNGRALPPDSFLYDADIVGALRIAVRALERVQRRESRDNSLPENAGKAWDVAEDQQLCDEFDSGFTVAQLAEKHARTAGAIRSRLQKLGRVTV